MKINKLISITATICLCLVSCGRCREPVPHKFHAGEIVRVKLTGERLSVVGKTDMYTRYDERYNVRNHEGNIRIMMSYELELDEQAERQ